MEEEGGTVVEEERVIGEVVKVRRGEVREVLDMRRREGRALIVERGNGILFVRRLVRVDGVEIVRVSSHGPRCNSIDTRRCAES